MDEIIAGIYGTGGTEKIASPNGQGQLTLSDLAYAITIERLGEDADMDKAASVHAEVHGALVDMDIAGRAAAHQFFSEIEKEAHAGNTEPLETFFEGYIDEGGAEVEDTDGDPNIESAKAAILAEVQRRLGK